MARLLTRVLRPTVVFETSARRPVHGKSRGSGVSPQALENCQEAVRELTARGGCSSVPTARGERLALARTTKLAALKASGGAADTFDASWSEEFNTVEGDDKFWAAQVRYLAWDFLAQVAKRPLPLVGESAELRLACSCVSNSLCTRSRQHSRTAPTAPNYVRRWPWEAIRQRWPRAVATQLACIFMIKRMALSRSASSLTSPLGRQRADSRPTPPIKDFAISVVDLIVASNQSNQQLSHVWVSQCSSPRSSEPKRLWTIPRGSLKDLHSAGVSFHSHGREPVLEERQAWRVY